MHILPRSGLQALSSSSVAGGKTGAVLDLAGMRENYVSVGIDEKNVPSTPHKLIAKWIEDACNCKEVSGSVTASLEGVYHYLRQRFPPRGAWEGKSRVKGSQSQSTAGTR